MQPIQRIQGNFVNQIERRILDRLCRMMPEQITADHLTLFGVFGAFVVLVGYLASHIDPAFLWLSVVGYVIHWFGDSLDGSLARFRQVTRPRYGYFLDHSVDAVCILVMIGGMGLSPFVHLEVGLLVVIGHFALSIYVFLKNQVTGQFQLSFMAFGPTEMRMAFIGVTLAMIARGPFTLNLAGFQASVYDLVMLGIAGTMLSMFVVNTALMAAKLRRIEGDGRRRPAVSPRGQRLITGPRRAPGARDATAH